MLGCPLAGVTLQQVCVVAEAHPRQHPQRPTEAKCHITMPSKRPPAKAKKSADWKTPTAPTGLTKAHFVKEYGSRSSLPKRPPVINSFFYSAFLKANRDQLEKLFKYDPKGSQKEAVQFNTFALRSSTDVFKNLSNKQKEAFKKIVSNAVDALDDLRAAKAGKAEAGEAEAGEAEAGEAKAGEAEAGKVKTGKAKTSKAKTGMAKTGMAKKV